MVSNIRIASLMVSINSPACLGAESNSLDIVQAAIIQARNAALQAEATASASGESTRSAATGRTIGGSGGNSPTGRTQQERNLA